MSRPPNFLFFLPDQHRHDWLGINRRLPLRTPNLDALAARGTVFTRAYTPSPLCAPARACLASGRAYGQCRVFNNNQDYPLDIPTYYQRLRDRGYRVCGVGKFDLHKDLTKPLFWELDGSRLLREWGFTEGIDNEGKLDGSNSYLSAGRKPRGPYLDFLAQRVLAAGLEEPLLLNVNVPNLPEEEIKGVQITRLGRRLYRDALVKRLDPRGRPYYWIGGDPPEGIPEEGTDIGALTEGYISVTPILLDLTDYARLPLLASWELTFPLKESNKT